MATLSKGIHQNPCQDSNPPVVKKKRNLPGTPDPEAEVIALSPKALMATNRFLCEICGKGFQRDQNLQLHRRGHNLPWKLRQRSSKEPRKRVYVCPEKSCVHNHPSRALGDLTGIKKHFCRKHGEKKWKCDKCSKRYAVQSDWKAHSKTCGTREYRCDCGTLFSRRDSFVTHRAFCDALAEETARVSAASNVNGGLPPLGANNYLLTGGMMRSDMLQHFSSIFKPAIADTEPAGPGLSLWSGNGEPMTNNRALLEMHQLGLMASSSAALYGDPFASLTNHPQLDCGQLSWLYNANKLSPPSSGELTTRSVKGSQSVDLTVPSLYSTQHQHPHPTPDMSATALLQKAALMGVRTSSPSFRPTTTSNNSELTTEGGFLMAKSYEMYSKGSVNLKGVKLEGVKQGIFWV